MGVISKFRDMGIRQPLAVANFRKAFKQALRRNFSRSTPKITSHPDVPSVVIAYNKFGAYCVPRSSLRRAICQTILSGRVWEPEIIAYILENAADGDVVHAGAYFGDFLPPLCKSLSPNRTVWAFEPLRESFRCAATTIALNDLTNVRLIQAALGDTSEALRFATHDTKGHSLGGESRVNPIGTETARQIRLDDAIPPDRRISIVQLDVEGYEAQALEGGRSTIERNRPIIILESVPIGFESKYGYVFYREMDSNSIFLPA